MGHPARGRSRRQGWTRVAAAAPPVPAETDPGVPGRRARCPASSRRPPRESARVQCQPDPIAASAGPAVAPGRAGRLTADNLAGSPRQARCACGHPLAPGEPRAARASVTGSRAGLGTRRRPGCSLRPHSSAGRGRFRPPAVGRGTVYIPRVSRDRLAKGKWRARPPATMAGRGMHNREGQDGAGHCEVVQR
jgi:hypothetical protein